MFGLAQGSPTVNQGGQRTHRLGSLNVLFGKRGPVIIHVAAAYKRARSVQVAANVFTTSGNVHALYDETIWPLHRC